jgi:hypothetical protein
MNQPIARPCGCYIRTGCPTHDGPPRRQPSILWLWFAICCVVLFIGYVVLHGYTYRTGHCPHPVDFLSWHC